MEQVSQSPVGGVEKPTAKFDIDFSNLIELCEEYLDSAEECGCCGFDYENMEHYIFETAMQDVFGNNVFKYINSR